MLSAKPILLIEDDDVDILSLKRAFRELTISNPLKSVTNGEDALSYLINKNNELPGLIILDMNMPRMNGIELLKQLKSSPVFKLIPVIILTTSSNSSDVKNAYESQVAGYMIKPIDFDEFKRMILHIYNYWGVSVLPY